MKQGALTAAQWIDRMDKEDQPASRDKLQFIHPHRTFNSIHHFISTGINQIASREGLEYWNKMALKYKG